MYSKQWLFRPVQQFGLCLSLQPASARGHSSPQKNAKYPQTIKPTCSELHPCAPMMETFLFSHRALPPASAGFPRMLLNPYLHRKFWCCSVSKIQIWSNNSIESDEQLVRKSGACARTTSRVSDTAPRRCLRVIS